MSVDVQISPSNTINAVYSTDLASQDVNPDTGKADVILLCKPKLHVRRERDHELQEQNIKANKENQVSDETNDTNKIHDNPSNPDDDSHSVLSTRASIELPATPKTPVKSSDQASLPVSPAPSNDTETAIETPRPQPLSRSYTRTLSTSSIPKPKTSEKPVKGKKAVPTKPKKEKNGTSTSKIEDEIDEIAKQSLQLIKKSRIKKEIQLVTESLGNAKIAQNSSKTAGKDPLSGEKHDSVGVKHQNTKAQHNHSANHKSSNRQTDKSENSKPKQPSKKPTSESENKDHDGDLESLSDLDTLRPHPPKTPQSTRAIKNSDLHDIDPVNLKQDSDSHMEEKSESQKTNEPASSKKEKAKTSVKQTPTTKSHVKSFKVGVKRQR